MQSARLVLAVVGCLFWTGIGVAQLPHCHVSRAQLLYQRQQEYYRTLSPQQQYLLLQQAALQRQLLLQQAAQSPGYPVFPGPGVPAATPGTPQGPGVVVPTTGRPGLRSSGEAVDSRPRRSRRAWERIRDARDANRDRSIERPELVLEGTGGRANDVRLNDYLVVLRTLPQDQRESAYSSDGALDGTSRTQFRRVRLCSSAGGPARRVGDSDTFNGRWPRALRNPEFTSARDQYERTVRRCRDAVADLGEMSYADEDRLRSAVDRLRSELTEAYPKSRRTRSTRDFREFKEAEEHLAGLGRLVYGLEPDDPRMVDPGPRFEGTTAGDLVVFMIENDLRFAAPTSADRPTYERLFLAMRDMVESGRETEAVPAVTNPEFTVAATDDPS